jgi:hypothetical protein
VSLHRYPTRALVGDYARAGAGLAMTLGPLLLVTPGPVMIAALGGVGTLFLVFGVRTWRRQMTRIEVTEDGIAAEATGGRLRRTVISWRDLSGLKLKYYSTRRDRREGWLQMSLKADNRMVRLDSSLDDFLAVARRAAEAARLNGLRLSPATIGNLGALGIAIPADPGPPEPIAAPPGGLPYGAP